jgi:D-arabinose 1-dehydrogenase-like Zn-dependent alcohol dehydrogenase
MAARAGSPGRSPRAVIRAISSCANASCSRCRRVSGSAVGGTAEAQELLESCAANAILPDCETIAIQQIGEAFVRMEKADVRYRFVVDMSTLEGAPS